MTRDLSQPAFRRDDVPVSLRAWLADVADALIPANDQMPAASAVDVAGRQLDVVLAARPDLLAGLSEAHVLAGDAPASDVLDRLPPTEAAREALLLVVAGGYYSSARVNALLDYRGQTPEPVRADTYPPYVAEGLLDSVLERGPIYRPTVESSRPSGTDPQEKEKS